MAVDEEKSGRYLSVRSATVIRLFVVPFILMIHINIKHMNIHTQSHTHTHTHMLGREGEREGWKSTHGIVLVGSAGKQHQTMYIKCPLDQERFS